VLIAFCIILGAIVGECTQYFFQKDIVEIVNNNKGAQWEAGINTMFEGRDMASVQRLMGWVKDNSRPKGSVPVVDVVDVPPSFDARQAWPNCTTIGTIQNQAECGSCWAFGAVEAITDRFCILKGFKSQLSFQDMVSCDDNDDGCQGGDAFSAWNYAKDTGLVTETCAPYTVPTCPPAKQPCLNFVDTPKCTKKCNDTSTNWKDDKHKVSSIYQINDPAAMQTDMLKNGPVEACFSVYEDFLAYKSGVYSHVHGKFLGGHCVKLLGWGAVNGTNYWLAANSWTDYWGDQGYFKIARGTDECGIEDDVVAGLP